MAELKALYARPRAEINETVRAWARRAGWFTEEQLGSDGETYVGQFAHGERSGKGTLTHANGDSFEGSFVRGMRHGPGVQRTAGGTTFEGSWEDDALPLLEQSSVERRDGRGKGREAAGARCPEGPTWRRRGRP